MDRLLGSQHGCRLTRRKTQTEKNTMISDKKAVNLSSPIFVYFIPGRVTLPKVGEHQPSPQWGSKLPL